VEILDLAVLQASISRRIGDKSYLKYIFVIPANLIEARGWTRGQEFDFRLVGKTGVLLQPTTKVKERGSLSFEEFAAKIETVLQEAPEGMPYGKIRELAGLHQSKPSAYWVKRMEQERGLIRMYDSQTSRCIWKLGTGKGKVDKH
jgi:hypothetical protein